jgi:predicted small secreted protein
MRSKISILFIAIILTAIGCTKNWDDHYNTQPETINTNVWEAIKSRSELSRFVELMVKYKYDTLFQGDDTYTIFAPDNAAIEKLLKTEDIGTTILNYHISQHYIKPVDIQGKRKLQTLAEKYSTFENINGKPTYDGIILKEESPLYINGKFFVMGEVAAPKLNLYEYFTKNTPYLKTYIDKEDSIILDKEKSRPIGFDDKGNTVYDTVSIKVNLFELRYFPVSEEFRNWTATFVMPKKSTYENGLTVMAQKLGGNFRDYKDIPVKWQEDVLIPHLVQHGIFLNMLEPSEFLPISVLWKRKKFNMVNINGDSIVCNYIPTDKYLSSNGVFYDYQNFEIPDSLFSGSEKFEGEWLAFQTGINKYAWKKNVTVTTTTSFDVQKNEIRGVASNDSILSVNFTKGYKGVYKVQFNVRNLFPRKYRMVVTTHMDIGGIYDIYVNNMLVKTFDYYDYVRGRGLIKSVTGITFVPKGRYNKFDFYVDNITEYGRPNIRFEYKGPGSGIPGNGLVIDLIEFIPAD